MAIVCYMANPMNTNEPFDLRLPTPGCYLDPEKAGMDSDAVFQGMTAHLFLYFRKVSYFRKSSRLVHGFKLCS